jgi:glycosyltransferase involved in cell wall biosynthesis
MKSATRGTQPVDQLRRLIVTIPALNEEESLSEVIREVPREIDGFDAVCVLVVDDGSTDRTAEVALEAGADWVVRNRVTMGLGFTFQRGLQLALERGADVVVNTDADNHYDQSAIPDLVRPIVDGNADIVIGSRVISRDDMPATRYYGNRLANRLMQGALALPGIDVSTGFRAYSREAALRTFVPATYTYTHETLLSAIDQRLVIANHPVPARKVTRPSRLMSGVFRHVLSAGLVIARSFLIYRPMTTYPLIAALLAIPGFLALARFLVEFAQGNGDGHTQSLVIGMALVVIAVQVFVLGLVAYAIRGNRWLLQELLRNSKAAESARTASIED